MFDEKYQERRKKIVDLILQYKHSISVTGAPGVGKTTLLRESFPEFFPERDKLVRRAKFKSLTFREQRKLVVRGIEKMMAGGIYDRHAIVDGYVFYCLTEEHIIRRAEENHNSKLAYKHSNELKQFKEWFWLYVTDFLCYIPYQFNILFIKSSVSKDELETRVIDRNRDYDDLELMKIFIHEFEDFALRTLEEMRALGVNINLMEAVL